MRNGFKFIASYSYLRGRRALYERIFSHLFTSMSNKDVHICMYVCESSYCKHNALTNVWFLHRTVINPFHSSIRFVLLLFARHTHTHTHVLFILFHSRRTSFVIDLLCGHVVLLLTNSNFIVFVWCRKRTEPLQHSIRVNVCVCEPLCS